MRYIKLFLLAVLIMSSSLLTAQSRRQQRVPAIPHPVEWIQPSGDTIMIRIVGDENWSCRYTEDGYALAENRRHALCYAKVDRKGNIKPTCIVVSRPDRRTRRELRYIEKMKQNEKLWRQFR